MLILFLILIIFASVLIFGAPYLPTLKAQSRYALDLMNVKPGQVVVDLGSGDGSFLIQAAKEGAIAYGYELNPILVIISKIRCFKHRGQVKIFWANFWNIDLPKETDFVYVFLLKRFMDRFDNYMKVQTKRLSKNLIVASYTFKIPNKKYIKHANAIYVYGYDKN